MNHFPDAICIFFVRLDTKMSMAKKNLNVAKITVSKT